MKYCILELPPDACGLFRTLCSHNPENIHHTSIVVRGNRIERTGSDGIRTLFCHNHYDAQVCPHDLQRMEKSGIDVRRLLEHAGDGMEWLQDQWELLNRLLMRDCVD